MTITSKGYEKSLNFSDWAVTASQMGVQYGVRGLSLFAATPGDGDREVKLAAGDAGGQGITDSSDASVTVAGANVTSGDRWDLIALRRDWTMNESTLVIITGGASKKLPTRKTDPGTTQDDQPLWLVRFSAGQTAVQDLVDLRVWHGDVGLVAKDPLVRSYLPFGSMVFIDGRLWIRGFDATGNDVWTSITTFDGTLTVDRVLIAAAGDVSASGGNPGLIIGKENTYNLGLDNNEIQARNNGQPSNLSINYDGGNVGIGASDGSSTVTLKGDVRVPEPKISGQPTTKLYADRADAALARRIDDLMRTDSRTSGVSNASGWSVSNILLYMYGPLAYFRASFTRTGSDLEVPDSGNIANELIGHLNVSDYCPRNVAALSHYSAGPLASAFIQANGDIYIAATANIHSIAKGTLIGFQGTYIR